MDISRRSLLFGSAAFAVVSALPVVAWAVEDWTSRAVHEIAFAPDAVTNGAATLTLFRRGPGIDPASLPLLSTSINGRGCLRWLAMGPRNEITLLPAQALDVVLDPGAADAAVEIFGTDHFGGGLVEQFVEIYRWPGPTKARILLDARGRWGGI